MSNNEPRGHGHGHGESGGGTDNDEGRGGGSTGKIDQKERKCESCGRKGKRGPVFRLEKGKTVLQQRRKHRGISGNSGCWAKRGGGGSGGRCFMCLKQPRAVESSGESPTGGSSCLECDSDTLTALIEKNDFYSKECNPHLDR